VVAPEEVLKNCERIIEDYPENCRERVKIQKQIDRLKEKLGFSELKTDQQRG